MFYLIIILNILYVLLAVAHKVCWTSMVYNEDGSVIFGLALVAMEGNGGAAIRWPDLTQQGETGSNGFVT